MAKECKIVESEFVIKDELIDYFHGLEDLQSQEINSVGNAKDRFTEDSLRLLRAFRFSITLEFTLSKEIQDCFHDSDLIKLLTNSSKERIKSEIDKCIQKIHI